MLLWNTIIYVWKFINEFITPHFSIKTLNSLHTLFTSDFYGNKFNWFLQATHEFAEVAPDIVSTETVHVKFWCILLYMKFYLLLGNQFFIWNLLFVGLSQIYKTHHTNSESYNSQGMDTFTEGTAWDHNSVCQSLSSFNSRIFQFVSSWQCVIWNNLYLFFIWNIIQEWKFVVILNTIDYQSSKQGNAIIQQLTTRKTSTQVQNFLHKIFTVDISCYVFSYENFIVFILFDVFDENLFKVTFLFPFQTCFLKSFSILPPLKDCFLIVSFVQPSIHPLISSTQANPVITKMKTATHKACQN